MFHSVLGDAMHFLTLLCVAKPRWLIFGCVGVSVAMHFLTLLCVVKAIRIIEYSCFSVFVAYAILFLPTYRVVKLRGPFF